MSLKFVLWDHYLPCPLNQLNYNGVIKNATASQIIGVSVVYSTVVSDTDQRKHQTSASLAFVRGIHRWPVNSPHKWPVKRKCFHLMTSSYEPEVCFMRPLPPMSSQSAELQWRHKERDGVSNHRRLRCLLNCCFRHRSKKTSNLRVTGLCAGNSPVTSEFPAQMASDAENVSIWWRHQMSLRFVLWAMSSQSAECLAQMAAVWQRSILSGSLSILLVATTA